MSVHNRILQHRMENVLRIHWGRAPPASSAVRLGATSHSSGPALPRRPRSTHRRWPATGTVMPSGPMLGTHQLHRPPHTTGLSLDSAFGWQRTAPTDAGLDDGADHVGVHKRIRLWWDAQPNESRLSCGADRKSTRLNSSH